jgi:hypothetical protein
MAFFTHCSTSEVRGVKFSFFIIICLDIVHLYVRELRDVRALRGSEGKERNWPPPTSLSDWG